MSFSSDVKNELAHVEPEKSCCKLAEISGFIRMCGTVSPVGGGKMKLILTTENPAIARHYKMLIKDYFSVDAGIEVTEGSGISKSKHYMIVLDDRNGQKAEIILRESGILMLRAGMNYLTDGIYDGIIKNKCCKKAYLRGAFLGAGTMTDPEKAYDIEFICNTETLAADIKRLIGSFTELSAKTSKRRQYYITYVREAGQIGDILNIMKAHQQYFELENIRLTKESRNNANRLKNCDTANADKMVDAAQKQLAAIKKIEETKGLGFLSEKLKEAALARKEHPDTGLAELAAMMQPPLTKSGLNNRLKKIEEMAQKI